MAQIRGTGGGYTPASNYWDEYTRRKQAELDAQRTGRQDPVLLEQANVAVDNQAQDLKPLDALNTSRQDLVTSQYDLLNRQAQEAAATSRQTLADQLSEQRRAYLQGSAQVSEDAFTRDRSLFQQLTERGLAGSGLQQLGEVQSRMAQGRAVSDLTQGYGQQVAGIGRAQTQLEQTLAGTLEEQALGKRADLLSLEEQDYERQLYAKDVQKQDAITAISAAAEQGGWTPELYQQLYATLGVGQADQQLADVLGTGGDNRYTVAASDVSQQHRTNLSSSENEKYITNFVEGNPMLDTATGFPQALESANGQVSFDKTDSPLGRGGYNDKYTITAGNVTLEGLTGGQVVSMIVSGQVNPSDELIRALGESASGKGFVTATDILGNKYDGVAKAFESWLMERGYLKKVAGTTTWK